MSTLDIMEIRNLAARLALSADEGDIDTYVTLWAPDGIWDQRLGMPNSRVEGLPAIREHFAERVRIGKIGPKNRHFHSLTSHAIEVDGDRATGRAYMVVHEWQDSQPAAQLYLVVKYFDEYVRIDGRWLLRHRILMPARMAAQDAEARLTGA